MTAQRAIRRLALGLVIVALAGCGDDDTAVVGDAPDFNGDGRVLIGLATDGPRDDGGYYQGPVDTVIALSTEFGFEEPIIVDLIDRSNAEAELRTIAEQGVDILVLGSSAISEPLPTLLSEFPEIFWYCNCGSGYPETPGLLISRDRGAELWISGGYAAGLLLEERGGTMGVFIGCCDLDFEKESFQGFLYGLQLVDPALTANYVATGNFPFDFHNTQGATEAFNAALAEEVDVVVAFLGGAHEPVVQLANEAGLIVMSGGSSTACERPDLQYDFEVKYSTGDYADRLLREVIAGDAVEGTVRVFKVGIDDEVGAEFCPGVDPAHVAALADLNERIGAGEFDDVIAQIVADVYGP